MKIGYKGAIIVFLITGKAGAGKSVYAKRLAAELRAEGKRVAVIDGDEIRRVQKNHDYTDNGRKQNIIRMANLARDVERKGMVAIVAAVTPLRVYRNAMRSIWYESKTVYIPGGMLWEGTEYERPDESEL